MLTELPMQADPTVMDGRRTVSTCMAYGVTAVTLLASIDGKDAYFEWSNYGEWEKLSLPPNMRKMGGPELLIGRDGRWHIIYKNYETDQIFCRSTL